MDPLIELASLIEANAGLGIALALGISVLFGVVFRKDPSAPFDDTPTTLVSEGARVPRVIGVDEVGAVQVYADNRFTRQETIKANGKGSAGGSQTATIYYESGIHCLAVGPGRGLRRISVQGETIFSGPITPQNAPSGTRVDLGPEGLFEIWWGDPSDPIDSWANEQLETGSKFDYFFRVNWIERRLGQVAQWPVINYEIEVGPTTPIATLDPADAWFEGNLVFKPEAEGTVYGIDFDENIFYFRFLNFSDALIQSGIANFTAATEIELRSVGGFPETIALGEQSRWTSAGFAIVTAEETNLPTSATCGLGPFGTNSALPPSLLLYAVRVVEDLPGTGTAIAVFNCQGTSYGQLNQKLCDIFPVVEDTDNGANGAHILASVLFEEAPLGVNQNKALWDLSSFATVSDLVVSEGLKSKINAQQGQTAQSVLAELLLDLGVFIRTNAGTGLLELVPIRPGVGEVLDIPAEAIQGKVPEIRRLVRPLRTNKVVYKFANRAKGYKDSTIVVTDDGAAQLNDFEGADDVRLTTVSDFESAAMVAQRREQEALGSQDTVQVKIGYGGRSLRPGQQVRIPQYVNRLLVLKSTPDPEGSGALLELAPTGYLAPPTPLSLSDEAVPSTGSSPTPAIAQARLWEPPSQLQLTTASPELRTLWVRANGSATAVIVNLSVAGTSYEAAATEPISVFGGKLSESMPDNSSTVAAVTMAFQSPDIATVPDLTGDSAGANAGQLLCLIEDELCFISGVSGTGPDSGQILSVQRAKYGTSTAAHAAGAPFYIFRPNTLQPLVNSAFIQAGVEFFFKLQAIGASAPTSLDEIPASTFTPAP